MPAELSIMVNTNTLLLRAFLHGRTGEDSGHASSSLAKAAELEKGPDTKMARPPSDSLPLPTNKLAHNLPAPEPASKQAQLIEASESSSVPQTRPDSTDIMPARWVTATAAEQPVALPAAEIAAQDVLERWPGNKDLAEAPLSPRSPADAGAASRREHSPRIPFGLATAGGSGMDFFNGTLSFSSLHPRSLCLVLSSTSKKMQQEGHRFSSLCHFEKQLANASEQTGYLKLSSA